ncbi:WD40 repeat-like protein [Sistotremastrum suecicum HHB10207 ss-3]|uniref:WD40 repeat-like protein n=1 Tax=Sistotremastrum suecicum HHB10207 ss-3 TaxID=1314776 RepID=A0A165YCM2_9AGAM|nr:WD40 repeat-like protein [Sistotremastrum suecicum HHB10207 ss-3]
MAPLVYRPIPQPQMFHTDGINSVAFSPAGRRLASAGNDYSVKVWSFPESQLLHSVRTPAAALSLSWYDESELLCGLANGTMLRICEDGAEIMVHLYEGDEYPIEHLSIAKNGSRLAAGGNDTITVWRRKSESAQSSNGFDADNVLILPPPPKSYPSADKPIFVTAIHWFGPEDTQILAGYLTHGIVIWDVVLSSEHPVATALSSWKLPISVIAHVSLSPNHDTYAVADFDESFTTYRYPSNIEIHHFENEERETGIPIRSQFIHGGEILLGGNSQGQMSLWGSRRGTLLQTLSHEVRAPVRAFSARFDSAKEIFWIATAACIPGQRCEVTLWKAWDSDQPMGLRSQDIKKSYSEYSLCVPSLSSSSK